MTQVPIKNRMDLKLVENDCSHPSNEEAADVFIA
jgi:hypothetical protein